MKLHARIKPSDLRSTWQGTHIDLAGSNLPLDRYSSVRAVDELVAEARLVVVGWSVGVKKSFFIIVTNWLICKQSSAEW